ncbi:MAG: ATP-binding protein [Planctomycetota bacterium]|jgi:predicted ATPase|nr:ATP-binding protein [Planctomycetota bacterium]MDP7134367.1 ATP-binding protein [Planctomycetota bacterium]MDP7251358.1 ATP-binding protein [Planctomycetota bacterium]
MNEFYVLTGGPAVGKTTLIEHLAANGHTTIRESARDVIEEQKRLGSDKLPWLDRPGFQLLVLTRQLEREEAAKGKVAFLDRGIPDGIAYLKEGGYEPLTELLDHARGRYRKAFLLEPIGDYQKDSVRYEDENIAREMHRFIEETYTELGYELVKIPAASVEERAEMLLRATQSSSKESPLPSHPTANPPASHTASRHD